jgi:hypothetical protein
VSALERLDLRFPRADKASLREFGHVREALENEGKGKNRKGRAKNKPAPLKKVSEKTQAK